MDFWIWYSTLKINAYIKAKLISIYKEPEVIFNLPKKVLVEMTNIEIANIIFSSKDNLLIKKMKLFMLQNDIRYITINSDIYPEKLKNIYDPPVILFYKGNIELIKNKCISIVGARLASEYGKKISERISNDLAKDYTIVSGLATGIDYFAHKGAINSKNGTIGVIGSGIDIVYPKENKRLYDLMFEKGLVLSEYPVGERPCATNFPARNRIISGIADGVIVVEAAKRSGALITADFALEQGKNVYAVPGNIDSFLSFGTNELIKNGAIPYTCPSDIEK